MKKILAISLGLFLGFPFVPYAAELEGQGTMMRKFQRGAANVALCPLELFNSLVRHHPEEQFPPGWLYGLAHGTALSVERAAIGIYEVVTFPLALPQGYKPILQPEFGWEYFV